MSKRLSEKKIKSLQEQRLKGYSVVEIARKENLSPQKVYYHTDLLDYILSLGYASRKDYREHLVKQRINPETGKKYASFYEYNIHQAKQRIDPETGENYQSLSEYNIHQVKQRINPETGKKYDSPSEYEDYNARKRQKRNKKFTKFLRNKLKKLNKKQSWLARKIGVSKAATSLYFQGKVIPSDDLLKKISVSLRVNYKTLEDLIE